MPSIVDRISQFIKDQSIGVTDFEVSSKVSKGTFARAIRENGAIGTDKLEKIISAYPMINPIWLLTGEGEMLNANTNTVIQLANGNGNKQTAHGDNNLLHRVEALERENALLRERLADKDKIIYILESQLKR